MPDDLEKLVGKKVAILVQGAKGVMTIKGEFKGIDGDYLEVESSGGMMGGKPKPTFFSRYGIIGIRLEE